MADAPIMPMDTGAFISDTLHLSDAETGAYVMLLFVLWRSGGSLDLNHKDLARFARVAPRRWSRTWERLAPFFTIKDARIYQKKATETLFKVLQKIEQNRKNARRGGEAKSLKAKEEALANGRGSADPVAPDWLGGKKSVKVPIKTKTKTKTKTLYPPKGSPLKGFTLWKRKPLSEEYRAAALKIAPYWNGKRLAWEYDNFNDYWADGSNRSPLRKNWLQVWRNWIRRRVEDDGRRPDMEETQTSGNWERRFEVFISEGTWIDEWGPRPDTPGYNTLADPDAVKIWKNIKGIAA